MTVQFNLETFDEAAYFEETGLLYPIGISNRVDAEAYLEHLEEQEKEKEKCNE